MDEVETNSLKRDNLIRKILSLITVPLRNTKMLFVILISIAIAATALLARTKPELLGIPQSQALIDSQDEINKLIEEVGKIIVLPEGENPTIATVTELDKVKDQKFFEKAQNGDKVLVYSNAKKAFIYRPSEKKIIEVGLVNIPTPTQTQVSGENDESENITPTSVSPTPTQYITPSPTPTITKIQTITPTPTQLP
ncbi:hypothetical protein A2771_03130 [Candidatus Woesebacteria bacterium RIFCSPHIGHO2_01_FULL_38_26b]|uniref:Uncharacterized protein n=1 Tax=Candidatus Woesebacteria bacterium RIFCSPHIGHO2_01_FULL_38_26b TaxID=1802491 RepID=A0A1F7Y0B1_9BACT|nr:MAG: hypothetical protein A2771_03130 [Candidatus Woesebacteria bacterium RIFCSPHIGHO2_01_FULL_38_26b]